MTTNRDLKKALLEKLDIKQPGLSKRVQKKKEHLPMSTEDATYLIAHESGIKIDKYLSKDEVDKIRQLHTSGGVVNNPTATLTKQRVQKGKNNIQEIRFPGEFKTTNPLLPNQKLNEAKSMAKLYPLLYVLENSIRELIKRVMRSNYGEDWWNTELNKGKLKGVKQTANNRMKIEKKNSWHQRRGDHPIDYVDITDLETIIRAKHSDFIPSIIPDREWFVQFMKELYPSRNVVCHMNPLDGDNVKDIQLRFKKWDKMIKNARDMIPD